MPRPKGAKVCESDGCQKLAARLERFCPLCRRRLLKKMAEDGYLTPIPEDAAREMDTRALRRPTKKPDRVEQKW